MIIDIYRTSTRWLLSIIIDYVIISLRVDLHTFADFLVRRGLVNAINLDGGGSATTVLNGTLVNYPSDQWLEFCPFFTAIFYL